MQRLARSHDGVHCATGLAAPEGPQPTCATARFICIEEHALRIVTGPPPPNRTLKESLHQDG